jgi:hypothetical protein
MKEESAEHNGARLQGRARPLNFTSVPSGGKLRIF